jgi:hypothetical protein
MKIDFHDIINTFPKHLVNCWLAYVLSQPVDIDLSMVLEFLKLYLGLPLVACLFYKAKVYFITSLNSKNAKESIEELVPQESYSRTF